MAQKGGSNYKLVYFNITAKAETIRMLFQMGGQKFTDERISFEQLPAVKPNTPFGQLPYLEYDGKKICQSRAIERMLAKKFNLYGASEDEQLHADMVRDCLSDMRTPFEKIKFGKPEEVENMKKEYYDTTGPKQFGDLEKMIRNADGYSIGKQVSWPDLELYNVIEFGKIASGLDMDRVLKDTPKIRKVHANVAAHPKVAEWLKNRPKTPF